MEKFADFKPSALDPKGSAFPQMDARQDWRVVPVARTPECTPLQASNFHKALEALGGEERDDVEVHRFGHHTAGWLEIVIVQPESEAEAEAEGIERSLHKYPVLDEEDMGRREIEEYERQWESWAARSFIDRVVEVARETGAEIDADEFWEMLVDADRTELRDWFEALNPRGDWHVQGDPNVEESVKALNRETVECRFHEMKKPDDTPKLT